MKQGKTPGGLIALLVLLSLGLCLTLGVLVKGLFFSSETSQETTPSSSSAQVTSAPSWISQENPVSIPILMYHAIHDMAPEEQANANLIVSPDLFESHVKALAEEGYYFLTPEEAYRVLTENSLPAQRVVWLTFDDSLWDFYDYAYPILKKYGARATNNVITGRTASGQVGHLTEAQLLEMQEAGLSFEGHTVSHPDLSLTAVDEVMVELADSKAYLDELLNQETMTLAYPSGRYNEDTLAIAKELGYTIGLTTNEGLASLSDGLLTLNRVRILPDLTSDRLLSYLESEN